MLEIADQSGETQYKDAGLFNMKEDKEGEGTLVFSGDFQIKTILFSAIPMSE